MSNSDIRALLSGVRFGKFASVGAVGAVFDLTTSSLLTVFLGVAPEIAKLVGAEVAIVVMFGINDRWTFAEHGREGPWPKLRRLLKSNLVRSVGLAVQVLVVRALSGLDVPLVVSGVDLWTLFTFPVAIAASVLVNYVAESLFTWRIAE